MRILVIEDDPETLDYVAGSLSELGHAVDRSADGREGLVRAVAGSDYDLLVVDRLLPGVDGLALVTALRAAKIFTPVLFLTTMSGVTDRVAGLKAGGDDYLVKPFAMDELAARVEALGRRAQGGTGEQRVLRVGDLELDRLSREVHRAGRKIELQAREFQLLEYLMLNAGQVMTRTMLLEAIWDLHFDPGTNVVESHVSRVRGKVDKGFGTGLIHTVRGAGYVIRAPA